MIVCCARNCHTSVVTHDHTIAGVVEITKDVKSWPQYFHKLTGLSSQTTIAEYSSEMRRLDLEKYLESNVVTQKDIAKAAYATAEISVLEKLVES